MNGLNINVTEAEHLPTREKSVQIKLNGREVNNLYHFKYLGPVIDTDGNIDPDVQAAWPCGRKLTRVFFDQNIPLRLKSKVCEAIIRPALTHGTE